MYSYPSLLVMTSSNSSHSQKESDSAGRITVRPAYSSYIIIPRPGQSTSSIVQPGHEKNQKKSEPSNNGTNDRLTGQQEEAQKESTKS